MYMKNIFRIMLLQMCIRDSLSAGKYKIKSYTTKKKNKGSLEYGEVNGADFEVLDNVTTEVNVCLLYTSPSQCKFG